MTTQYVGFPGGRPRCPNCFGDLVLWSDIQELTVCNCQNREPHESHGCAIVVYCRDCGHVIRCLWIGGPDDVVAPQYSGQVI